MSFKNTSKVSNRIAKVFSYRDPNERFNHGVWPDANGIYSKSSIYFFPTETSSLLFLSFFFSPSPSSRYDFNSHFPSQRNFLYKLHPSRSTQAPIFNFLFITTDPENRFSTSRLANSHGRKKKKKTFTHP